MNPKQKTKKQRKKKKPVTAVEPSLKDRELFVALFRKRHYEDAEQYARKLANKFPQSFFGWKALGSILILMKRPQDALDPLKKAMRIDPGDHEICNALATACKNLNLVDEAKINYAKALRLKPHDASTLNNLGQLHQKLGQATKAKFYYEKALSSNPHLFEVINNLLFLLKQEKQYKEAQALLEKALVNNPDNPQILSNLGDIFKADNQFDKAVACYQKALRIAPDQGVTYNNLGTTLHQLGRFEEALVFLKQAVEKMPLVSNVHNNLGNTLNSLGRSSEASEAFQRALQIHPENAEAYNNLGSLLLEEGRVQEARTLYRKSLSLDRNFAEAWSNMGEACKRLGRLNAAKNAFQRAMRLKPDYYQARAGIAALFKAQAGEESFELLLNALQQYAGQPRKTMSIHFALGKMYADIGDYGQSFSHYSAGNKARAVRFGHVYDPTADMRRLDLMQSLMQSDFFKERADWALDTELPIFIVGMPRSGTTLLEQILSSHSLVHGAGELTDLNDRLVKIVETVKTLPPAEQFKSLQSKQMRAMGQKYLDMLTGLAPGKRYVVNKMPHNFELLWLIALLFPKAAIIHSTRSPLDTCLSIFCQNFTTGHAYKNKFEDIAMHFVYYFKMVDHWKNFLPVPFHNVKYEALTSEPESGIKQLLGICGLDFEPACLEFHKNRRPVLTASLTQVRQKAYTTSIGKWKTYERFLYPLISILQDNGIPLELR